MLLGESEEGPSSVMAAPWDCQIYIHKCTLCSLDGGSMAPVPDTQRSGRAKQSWHFLVCPCLQV